MKNELEILTQIEANNREIAETKASVLKPDEFPTLGQLCKAKARQEELESHNAALEWVLAQPARLIRGDKVRVTLVGKIKDTSDAHGLCYEVQMPQMHGFTVRNVWVDPSEVEVI